jgi:hypothetical protein
VTRFEIDRATSAKYEIHAAGGSKHNELWAPAEELDQFNNGIVGLIEVVASCSFGGST